MSKLPRLVAKEIAKLASALPKQIQGVPEYRPVYSKGKVIARERTGRVIKMGTVNHERRMKKAYYQHGVLGYLMYFDAYVKPGPLKLQIWQNIAELTGRKLEPEFINQLNPPVVKEPKLLSDIETEELLNE